MPTHDWSILLEIATNATRLGADIALSAPAGNVRHKSARDLVTDVDLHIQAAIGAYLEFTTPNIPLLAEEGPQLELRSWPPLLWVLDPIDGTTNFVHGLPMYAISLALLSDGRPVAAAVNAPLLGNLYHASENGGAYCNNYPVSVSETARLPDAIVSLGDYAVGDDAERINTSRIKLTSSLAGAVARIRMFGSAALDLAFLAQGLIDGAVILDHQIWDTAAGELIAREAGAFFVDIDRGPRGYRGMSTVATTPRLAAALASVADTLGAH